MSWRNYYLFGWCSAVAVLTTLFLGCGESIRLGREVESPRAEPDAVNSDGASASDADRHAADADEPAVPPASEASGRQSASVSSTYPVRLSAGTALPQTLPTGTAVGFSVDYQWVQEAPATVADYLWEIKDRDGQIVQTQVELRPSGTLQGFFDVRPEQGPFQSRLVQITDPSAPSGEPLSRWQEMR